MRELRGDLNWITAKTLERDRERRYSAPSELVADLRRYLNYQPIEARPAARTYRIRKFAQRHRIGLLMSTMPILGLAGGLAATPYEARIAAEQRDVALQAQQRSLTLTAAAHLKEADVAGAMGIILEVLPHRGVKRPFLPEALSVFQEARASDAQIMAITGHGEAVLCAAFSPDGHRVVIASQDKTARIWDRQAGVARAGFELGRLYEAGLSTGRSPLRMLIAPDQDRAWWWYRRAAARGEPGALARFAERAHRDALAATDPARKDRDLLQAFRFYAAAVERAQVDSWPDDSWKAWRYRRASLARLLERREMMKPTADAYASRSDLASLLER